MDKTIHFINHYPLDRAIGFAMTYSLDSDLSGREHYPSFEQLGPRLLVFLQIMCLRLDSKILILFTFTLRHSCLTCLHPWWTSLSCKSNLIYFPFGRLGHYFCPACPTIVTSSFVVINLQGKQLISCYQFTLSINNSVDVVIRIQWSQRQ